MSAYTRASNPTCGQRVGPTTSPMTASISSITRTFHLSRVDRTSRFYADLTLAINVRSKLQFTSRLVALRCGCFCALLSQPVNRAQHRRSWWPFTQASAPTTSTSTSSTAITAYDTGRARGTGARACAGFLLRSPPLWIVWSLPQALVSSWTEKNK